jgi:mono/diheme cytochrome c family protein
MAKRRVWLGVVGVPVLVVGLSAQQPVRSAAPTAIESGKKLFVQRCSVCHLPPLGPGQPQSVARSLSGVVKSPETEAPARQIILRGIPSRMPGFQYGLTSAEVDSIVAYLRTLK